jgi:hypothetical protein
MTGNNRNLLIDGDFQAVDLTSGHSGVVTDTVVGNYTSTVPTGWSSSTGGVGDFAPTAVPSPVRRSPISARPLNYPRALAQVRGTADSASTSI